MPAIGPNLQAVRSNGRELGKAMLKELIEKHRLLDITDERYAAMPMWPGADVRWEAAKEAFVAAVGELFAEDAANSF